VLVIASKSQRASSLFSPTQQQESSPIPANFLGPNC
jgi:hypothetical protein